MDRYAIMLLMWSVCILSAMQTQAESGNTVVENYGRLVPTITITRLHVTDTSLELSWEIRNDSAQDAWILAGLDKSEITCSVFMNDDDQTLLIRRRLDLPARPRRASFPVCNGRYVRLPAGEKQVESISLAIPVHCEPGIGVGGREARGLEHAVRLSIEIGCYTGDLTGIVRRTLEQDEKNPRTIPAADPTYTNSITGWFEGLLGFNELNEDLRSRDDEVLIPYTDQAFTGEQVLWVTVDDQHIPYEEIIDRSIRVSLPDLAPCTRVEIQYQPSALEYFFPHAGQQSLLSPSEKEYLLSMKTIVVESPDDLKSIAYDVSTGIPYSGIVRQRSVAHVTCYRDDEILMLLPIYDDDSIVTKGRDRFQYPNGLQSLRAITPRVQSIELRMKCSANLKNLWHRFRLFEKANKPGFLSRRKKSWPAPGRWCVSMVQAYHGATGSSEKYLKKAYVCPSAGQGECHYAMNPNCAGNSPPDTVLLFESKAGWNQHGGPELFTFDNHDPKGGCVLLNDGTVKFIRTKQELQQLRWK